MDHISDMLTRIRNAGLAKHKIVAVYSTKLTLAIANILKDEGFILGFSENFENKKNYLLISLKYKECSNKPFISKIVRVSKPSLRVYSNSKNLPKILNNLGFAIVSTSKGVMTNIKSKKFGVGGEILCYVW